MRRALGIFLLLAVGCQPVHRVGSEKKPASPPKKDATPITPSSWMAPNESTDSDPSLVFVAREPGREKAWDALPAFWNPFPMPGAGAPTAHIGLDPLGAFIAIVAAQELEAIHVKVPRHLGPVPIDPANPPTLGRWLLGKRIFFDRVLRAGNRTWACASCHQPDRDFADNVASSFGDARRTISLVDVAVRSPLFWDGRVERLEEVLMPTGSDRHRFDGVADRLNKIDGYHLEFRRVMGISRVSDDAVAKVLAIYLRTILSGEALVDRVHHRAGTTPGRMHTAAEFEALLNPAETSRLNFVAGFLPALPERDLAKKLAEGQWIALGSGRCYRCHPTPGELGRGGGFHNTLVGDSDDGQSLSGRETGRFAALPIGRKDFKLRGAYRAPPLRNLTLRAPYFHDGSATTLRGVISHYNLHLDADHPLLDPILAELVRNSPRRIEKGRRVPWNDEQVDALVLYLAACEGEPVDVIVSRP